ncbi:MAG: alpha/beta hydrolase [Brevundimonas sp.]
MSKSDAVFKETPAPSGRGRLFVSDALPFAPLPGREVFVWTPEAAETGRRLPVIYVQDGQNLFDARRVAYGAAWEIDACLSRLADASIVPPTIVVGIACCDRRLAEYAPHPILDRAGSAARDAIQDAWGELPSSGAYADLVIDRIRPIIDRAFPTRRDRASTFVAGASMGGVAALEILARRPDVFGGAAALSAHLSLLPVDGTERIPDGFSADIAQAVGAFACDQLPAAGRHRIWLDRSEHDVDRHYGPSHDALVAALIAKGYRRDIDLAQTDFAGVGHNEAAWRDRLDLAMAFLLAEAQAPA